MEAIRKKSVGRVSRINYLGHNKSKLVKKSVNSMINNKESKERYLKFLIWSRGDSCLPQKLWCVKALDLAIIFLPFYLLS